MHIKIQSRGQTDKADSIKLNIYVHWLRIKCLPREVRYNLRNI